MSQLPLTRVSRRRLPQQSPKSGHCDFTELQRGDLPKLRIHDFHGNAPLVTSRSQRGNEFGHRHITFTRDDAVRILCQLAGQPQQVGQLHMKQIPRMKIGKVAHFARSRVPMEDIQTYPQRRLANLIDNSRSGMQVVQVSRSRLKLKSDADTTVRSQLSGLGQTLQNLLHTDARDRNRKIASNDQRGNA